jgi:16S rRNA G966 N2-methylase RsmD
VVDGLRRNVERLDLLECCTIVSGPVLERLERLPASARGPFELIFADPPYRGGEAGRFLPAAAAHLATGGTLVIERDRSVAPAVQDGLSNFRTARYGRTCVDFYRRTVADRSG